MLRRRLQKNRMSDLVKAYPQLKDALPAISETFRLLHTPMGKIMLKEAAVGAMVARACREPGTADRTTECTNGRHLIWCNGFVTADLLLLTQRCKSCKVKNVHLEKENILLEKENILLFLLHRQKFICYNKLFKVFPQPERIPKEEPLCKKHSENPSVFSSAC